MELGLNGKIALVTAASDGIAKAIGLQLAKEGASVSICARGREALIQTAEEIHSMTGMEVFAVQTDITIETERAHLVKETINRFGSIDILVNNCGSPAPVPVNEISIIHLEETFNLILISAVDFCLQALPSMKERKWGRIINIASVFVKQPVAEFGLSSTVRPSILGFSKCLSDEVALDNITVNVVCPGFVMTEAVEKAAHEFSIHKNLSLSDIYRQWTSTIPMRRIANPEEIASVVAFLASERASYITGTAIQVDGGMVRGIL